jgi:polysaccharide deacetylase family protein (PEP-CTERM system associated)
MAAPTKQAQPVPGTSAGLPDGLSVDVEDYYHVEAFADRIRPAMWPQFPSRVADNTRRLLELLARTGARATFFLLGWTAEREPDLVREIALAGHEVACHSYLHRPVWRMKPQEFRDDTRRARAAIEAAVGQKVVGYRAPTFSIVRRSLWALEILAEEAFLYDSSIFPIRHDLYGLPEAPRFAFRWEGREGRAIYELPLTTVRVLGYNLPVAGGGYLRIFPLSYTRWALGRVRQKDGQPAIVYFHPWEIDPAQPRLPGKWKSRLRHYLNLWRMEERISKLLAGRRFVPLADYLQSQLAQASLPTWRLAGGEHPGNAAASLPIP